TGGIGTTSSLRRSSRAGAILLSNRRLSPQHIESPSLQVMSTAPALEHLSAVAGPVVTVDVDAVVANYRLLAERVRPAKVAGVVKADGYGLGAIPIARALARAGCETFFVAHTEEGMALRDVLPKSHILVLHGFYRHAMAEFANKRLIPVLSSLEQVEAWLDCG